MKTSRQIDIPEQKKLKTSNSLNNCLGAWEKSLASYSHSSELISEEIFDRKFKRRIKKEEKLIFGYTRKKDKKHIPGLIEKTGRLNFSVDEKNLFLNTIKAELNNFENFKSRLCGGSKQNFRVQKCKDCDTLILGDDGKPIVYPVVCESPYCPGEDCMIHRKLKAKSLFDVFLWGNRNWIRQRDIRTEDVYNEAGEIIKYSDLDKNGELKKHLHKKNVNGKIKILYTRWGHWAFGFKRRSDLPDRLQLENFRIQLNNFLKALREELHLYIKGVGVRDIAYDIEKVGEEYFFHFHMALRPFNTNDKTLEKINKIGERYNIKPNFIGYRECYSLSEYFAKRHSGQFEHKSTDTNWMYKDIMDIKTYFRLFYGSRKLIHTGFTNKEVEYLKARFKQKLKDLNQALEESLLSSTNKEQSRCPECGSTNIIIDYCKKCDIKHLRPPDPPPGAPEKPVEVIKH